MAWQELSGRWAEEPPWLQARLPQLCQVIDRKADLVRQVLSLRHAESTCFNETLESELGSWQRSPARTQISHPPLKMSWLSNTLGQQIDDTTDLTVCQQQPTTEQSDTLASDVCMTMTWISCDPRTTSLQLSSHQLPCFCWPEPIVSLMMLLKHVEITWHRKHYTLSCSPLSSAVAGPASSWSQRL